MPESYQDFKQILEKLILNNKHNLESVRAYFDCDEPEQANVQPSLIKPAIARAIGNSEQWQIQERGQLQFQSQE